MYSTMLATIMSRLATAVLLQQPPQVFIDLDDTPAFPLGCPRHIQKAHVGPPGVGLNVKEILNCGGVLAKYYVRSTMSVALARP
jgi:hypothetical protein